MAVATAPGNIKTSLTGVHTYLFFGFRKYARCYLAMAQYLYNRCIDLRPIPKRIERIAKSGSAVRTSCGSRG